MKTVRLVFCLLLALMAFNGYSQSFQEKLEAIREEVRSVIGKDWFLTQTASGFKVTFCRSCQKHYEDSCNYQDKTFGFHFPLSRDSFFNPEQIDSVCYYPTVSLPPQPFYASDSARHADKLKAYQVNGILSFEIRIEAKWDEKKYRELMAQNELLKTEILKEPLYKTSKDIFSDYRFYLPEDYLKQRTEKYPFYFERLPYSSKLYDYSIFLIPDKPNFFCSPLYVDKSDPRFYDAISNFLEEERQRTLKIIALSLGILDFKIVN